MPNRRVHEKITAVTGVGIAAIGIGSQWDLETMGLLLAGVGATFFLGPDLDLHHRLGKIGDVIGASLYRDLVPHRFGLHGKDWRLRTKNMLFFSHVPFVGTIPRTVMAFLGPGLCLMLFAPNYLFMAPRIFLGLWLGMSISDMAHVLADLLTSGLNRIGKNLDIMRQRPHN